MKWRLGISPVPADSLCQPRQSPEQAEKRVCGLTSDSINSLRRYAIGGAGRYRVLNAVVSACDAKEAGLEVDRERVIPLWMAGSPVTDEVAEARIDLHTWGNVAASQLSERWIDVIIRNSCAKRHRTAA
eukprot:TRINITY_DN77804_c0_g1_i1.p1 TRINITY_DN77804_c0_g1~~TRINITY_DN77804_c0_g1_i1.p1  ORF type:complete len:129 (-),score=8.48 TRINITY_DN77804_c0_g1_i1:392-778(-)